MERGAIATVIALIVIWSVFLAIDRNMRASQEEAQRRRFEARQRDRLPSEEADRHRTGIEDGRPIFPTSDTSRVRPTPRWDDAAADDD